MFEVPSKRDVNDAVNKVKRELIGNIEEEKESIQKKFIMINDYIRMLEKKIEDITIINDIKKIGVGDGSRFK